MAGGSADAAAVLVAMNTLWELGVPRRDLHTLAAQLGSDVPFALHGGTALGTGRGEELATVLARNTFHWVLAFADRTGCPTPAVFAEIDRLRESGCRPGPAAAARRSGAGAGRTGGRRPGRAGAAAGQRPAAGGAEPRPRTAAHACARAPRPARWRASCPGRARRVRSCARRRPRPSMSARSWRAPGCAAPCGWPAGPCTARGWCRRRRRRFDYSNRGEFCVRAVDAGVCDHGAEIGGYAGAIDLCLITTRCDPGLNSR